jgi:hypothetical protein
MAKSDSIEPRFYELEAFRRSVGRKLWFGMILLFIVSLGSLLLALVAIAKPVPVVAFDSQGRPVLFEDTVTPRQKLEDVRIEYFVQEFVRRYVGVDSAAITEDLNAALAMMTPAFRQIVAADEAELARRKQYEGQNIRSAVRDWKVRIGAYKPEDTSGKVHVLVTGKMVFEPRFGELEGGGEVLRFFLSQIVLQRVPVTKISIHGLLVDFCHTRFFDSLQDLEVFALQRKPA